jgi:hypothetical protein
MLIKDLNSTGNLRNRSVGNSGISYKPLDNEFQIKEALDEMCSMISNKKMFLKMPCWPLF